jgi:predicted permease
VSTSALIPAKIPRTHEVALDGRVLLFALLVSIFTGILFGLAPALQASRGEAAEVLKETSTAAGRSRKQGRTTGLLVSAQFAVCLMLMVGAGLLLRTFWTLLQTDPGFQTQGVVVGRIWLPQPNDPKADPYAKPEDRAILVREVLRRMQAVPGVSRAAISTSVPLSGSTNRARLTIEGFSTTEPSVMELVSVSPDYFEVLKTPLVEGRSFAETDQLSSMPVAVVDRATARRYWPNASPIGKRLKRGPVQSPSPWMTVVGVVGDIRHDGLETDGVPHIYTSIYQLTFKTLGVMARSQVAPAELGEQIRREIQAVDSTLPVFGIRTLSDMVDSSLAQRRFAARLVGAFAILALLLSAVGIYGVLAYSVGQRTRELGIRMALGAQSPQVIRMVLLQAMQLIGFGVVAGVLGAFALVRAMSGLLYGTGPADPLVFVAAPALLVAVAVVASCVPAYRATRIDPVAALR